MSSATKLAALAIGAWPLAGCSIAGTWKTVSVEPPGQRDALFSVVTFGRDNLYTAVTRQNGQESTAVGQYEWNGRRLRLMPKDGQPYEFAGERGLGKALILTRTLEGGKVTGKLELQPD